MNAEDAMRLGRRELLGLTAAVGLGALATRPAAARRVERQGIKAIAFDAFAVFDPRPIAALAETLFPGKGRELTDVWRTRQFEYQWLRVALGRYADFWQATEDALDFAAELLGLPMPEETRRRLMSEYLALRPWPDAGAALDTLRRGGFRLALLSNATPRILRAGVANGGLSHTFEHVISTDERQTFKPDPRAYALAPSAFGLEIEEILFVPFAGWDAAGAKSFGYPTYWVNRSGAPAERLSFLADEMGRDLDDLTAFLTARDADGNLARP